MTPAVVLAKTSVSFKDLADAYSEGVDYQIHVSAGLSPTMAMVAPHRYANESPTSQVSAAIAVVTVPGCTGVNHAVVLGGRDKALGVENATALGAEGVYCKLDGHKFFGTDASNICNRGRSRAGVQLELTPALRKSPEAVAGVVRAVRNYLLRLAYAAAGPREPLAGVI